MKTGKSINKLVSHTKSITCLALYDPKDGASPILVSGSLDKKIIIWDVLEATEIRRLPLTDENGHSERINSLSVYDRSSDGNSPFIASCSEDKSVLVI